MSADSSLPVDPLNFGFSTMCVSFCSADRITVLHLDSQGLSLIRQSIKETWKAGISKEKAHRNLGWSFKLYGCPFEELSLESVAQEARLMVCRILQKLYGIGWEVISASSLRRCEDRSTLFFKRFPVFSIHPLICIGLNCSDKLQVINVPQHLVDPVKEGIQSTQDLRILKEKSMNGLLDVKLSGDLWTATGKQSIMVKVLLQNIIATLLRYQWVYYCTVNLKGTSDSLFFRYDGNIPPSEFAPLCTISLNRTNRVRVINPLEAVVSLLRQVIKSTWSRDGIQHERDFHGSWEFTLSGNPWYCVGEESIKARYVVLKILEEMQQQGWHYIAGIDFNRWISGKSVLIFQKGEPQHYPMMCLSLNNCDKLRLINMPAQLVELFKQILLCRWSKGIQKEKQLELNCGAVCEMKLAGLPWQGNSRSDTLDAHSFLCNIVEKFMQRGWRLFLSANVSGYAGLHSLWFVQDSCANHTFNFTSSPEQYRTEMPPFSSSSTYSYLGHQISEFGTQPDPYSAPFYEPPPSYIETMGWNPSVGTP